MAGEDIRFDAVTIEWAAGSGYALDVAEVTRLIQESEQEPLNAEALGQAADLYSSELLPGVM